MFMTNLVNEDLDRRTVVRLQQMASVVLLKNKQNITTAGQNYRSQPQFVGRRATELVCITVLSMVH